MSESAWLRSRRRLLAFLTLGSGLLTMASPLLQYWAYLQQKRNPEAGLPTLFLLFDTNGENNPELVVGGPADVGRSTGRPVRVDLRTGPGPGRLARGGRGTGLAVDG